MENKKANLYFYKNRKQLNKNTEVIIDGWRTGEKQAALLIGCEICWYSFPNRAKVILDGIAYYFKIEYTPRYGYDRKKKERYYIASDHKTILTYRKAVA